MQAKVTVRVPVDVKDGLVAAARRMNRKTSEVARLALIAFLQGSNEALERRADRVRALLGSVESGVPHLAARHRAYVVESLTRRR
jgi:predicted transcriptional regulator